MHTARVEIGRRLAKEHPAEADLVIPVPESGTPAAIGYAEASGIPYGTGLVKNAYVGRTFIQPSQTIRQLGIRLKLNPLRDVIRGKRLVVVDDSIVRGNTQRALVRMLREAGAVEVHVRISSPPVKWPCFYGIDFGIERRADRERPRHRGHPRLDRRRLARATSRSTGTVAASEQPYNRLCCACFDGALPDRAARDRAASTCSRASSAACGRDIEHARRLQRRGRAHPPVSQRRSASSRRVTVLRRPPASTSTPATAPSS